MATNYKKTITLGLDYSEFTGGMAQCNQSMTELNNQFKIEQAQMEGVTTKSQQLQKKTEYLTDKVNIQQKKVELARQRYEALKAAHADTSQIEKAGNALDKEVLNLEKYRNELTKTAIEQSNLKESIAGMVATVAAVGAAFVSCAKDAADYADEINTLSSQTGVSTETLQEWGYAADLMDTSLDTITNSFKKLESKMASATNKNSDAYEAFKKLGVSVKDSTGHMRNAEDVFMDVIDSLGKIQNETEQDQMAMKIFGKNAVELTGIINTGSDGLKEYAKEAKDMGIILSQDELNAANKLKDSLDKLDSAFDNLKQRIGLTVVPVLTDLIEVLLKIPTPVLATVAVVGSLVVVVVAIANAINSVSKAWAVMKPLFAASNALMDTTYIKILLIVAALTALAVAIAVIIGKGQQMNQTLQNVGNISGANTRTGHNAKGTQNWRGGETWVGENGPEIVDLPPGSKIYNNNESKAIGGDTYNITMNCDLSKMKRVNDVVEAVQGLALSGGAC